MKGNKYKIVFYIGKYEFDEKIYVSKFYFEMIDHLFYKAYPIFRVKKKYLKK